MIKKLRAYLNKQTILYLVFGILTTAVNYAVYFPLHDLAGFSAAVSNLVAWAAAVVFAYVTNKLSVFESKSWKLNTVLGEMGKFVASRLISGLLETVLLLVTVDLLGLSSLVMKLLAAVGVIIFNYLASKLYVFK